MPAMNVAKLQEIYDAALEISDAVQRRAMLADACGGDSELRVRVEELLATQVSAESFFSDCAQAVIASKDDARLFDSLAGAGSADAIGETRDLAGSRIGPYKLLQLIGEGGCGAVYMAEQEKPVRRKVALKVIKLGMDTRSVIARFEAERQALALMDHPNIARVLDAGATETGRPYFVMELVHGIRITEYCDKHSLSTRERLGLFIQVCQAIQHAHQKGIIHRDIKPSNILVTMLDGAPVPKVIDFGIAKAIEEKLTDKTLFTLFGHFVGTPAYMSPEQAQMSGLDVDTRSDIYSLGVLLYELLTGKTPFDQQELLASGIEEMSRTLREREPHRPSTKLDTLPDAELTMTAQRRHVEAPKLRLELQGDLDWIVMKALEKERARRYQTANGLAMDVQRSLDNEPVQARSPSRLYRFQKLVRRNRIIFAAGGVATLALLVGFGTSTWMFFRERKAHQEQIRLSEIADAARKSETKLRREAEAQASIAQAAILLSRTNYPEADALVDEVDLPVTRPSLEATEVFQKLAQWNVTQGHWSAAGSRFLKLVEASQIDKTDMTDTATRELLKVGPALLLTGRTNEYQHFIRGVIRRFAETKNPVAAEHVVKASTLLPMDEETLQLLRPLAGVLEEAMNSSPPRSSRDTYMAAWLAFALARFEYRCGNLGEAIERGEKCLAYSDQVPPRTASMHALLALAHHRLGETRQATMELTRAETMVQSNGPASIAAGLPHGTDQAGLWYDWIEALLMIEEAAATIEGRPAVALVSPERPPSSPR